MPRLLWLRRHNADLTIYTLPQLDQIFRARRDALNAPQEPQPQRQVLNQAPRADYYDRIAAPIGNTSAPVDLDLIEGEPAQ